MKKFTLSLFNRVFLTVGGACLVLPLLFSSCENDLDDINRLFSEQDIDVEVARDVTIYYSDSAIVRVMVKGPTMKRYTTKEDPREEFPDGVHVDFFDRDKAITSRLTAKKGIRYESKGLIIVRDSVVWESLNKEKLETSELIWDESKEKVYTNKFVVVRRPGEVLYGYGFESNQDFSRSRIRAIEGRLKVDDLEKEFKD